MTEQAKPQDDVETATAPDETPQAPEAEGQEAAAPEQDETVPEGEPESPETAAQTPEPEPEYEPFSYTADKRRFDVEGAFIVKTKDKEGNPVEQIVMPRDSWNRLVQRQLRDPAAIGRKEAEYQKQIAALDPENHETTVRARALLSELEGVLKDEESLTNFLSNFQQNKELWTLKAEKAVHEARLKGYTTQEDTTRQAARDEEIAGQIVQDIPDFTQHAAEFVTTNWNVPVDPRALQAARQQISENIGAYYRYATANDAQQHGVTQGELIRDDDAVVRTIHRFATILASTNKVEDVKTKNQAALGGGKAAPKTVPAKGSPAAADKPKSFKTKEEWQAHMGLNT